MKTDFLSDQKFKEVFTIMMRIRAFEERAIVEYRNGHIPGFLHVSIGQEAIPSGVCAMIEKNDYVLTTHRGHGDIIAKGARFDRMFAELFGKKTGYCKGKGGSMHISDMDFNIVGATGIVGSGIPIATGVGLGCKMKNLDSVCVCFFGDGATSTGAFHEGINLAAIWNLPVIFVCQNNQYGESTPMKDYTRVKHLSDKANAYGIPGVTVDGNDVIAVSKESFKAIKKARNGEGPTLIEGITYRYYGHHLGDPSTSYRTKEEVEEWKKLDPILRMKNMILSEKIMTETEIKEIETNISKEIEEAVKFALESSEPDPKDAICDIYYKIEVKGKED